MGWGDSPRLKNSLAEPQIQSSAPAPAPAPAKLAGAGVVFDHSTGAVTRNNAFESAIFNPGGPNGMPESSYHPEMGPPTYVDPPSYHTGTDSLIEALIQTKDVEGAKRFLNMDAIGKVATQLKQQSQLAGVKWDNAAGNAQRHMLTHAKLLVDKGVTDLKQLRKENGVWVYGKDKQVVDIQEDKVGNSPYGDGMTDYKLATDSQGRPIAYQSWGSSSDAGKIAGGLGLVLSIAAPGAGAALGKALGLAGTTATVVGSGVISGGLSAVAGADASGVLKSAVLGGVSPAISSIPGISNLPPLTKKLIAGAVTGGLRSGDSKGALLGAVTGGLSGGATIGDRLLRAIVGQTIKQKVTKP